MQMAELLFALRGPGPPSWQEALTNPEAPKNGNTTWRNHLNKGNLPLELRGAFLPTTAEDELSLHGSSLAFVACPQLISLQPKGKYLLGTSGMVKTPARGKAAASIAPTLAIPSLCSTNLRLNMGRVGCQGSCRSTECLLHCERNSTRKQTNWGEIKWSLERSVFVPELQFRSLQAPTGSSAVWLSCSAKASHRWPDSLGEYLQKTNQIINQELFVRPI